MRLNALGRASMNNAARRLLQERYMAPMLHRLGGGAPAGRSLEVGTGRGAMLPTIRTRFRGDPVVGLDLDPVMISSSPRARRSSSGGRFVLGDVGSLPFAEASFDSVFDFGAIHFVADWERALDEVRRVLAPGGRYFFEWVTGRGLRAFYALAAERFESMRAPSPERLLRALADRGMPADGSVAFPRWAARATWLVGDVIGVARVG
jgi:ubiquinone/menaquinone biosynthesis C-methylase UbiE